MSKSRTSKSGKGTATGKKNKTIGNRISSDPGSSNQPEMKTSEIRDLIDFISKTGLNEVNIETSELKRHVKREPDQKVFKSTPVVTSMAAAPAPAMPAVQPQAAAAPAPKASADAGKKTVEIKSPMIGTFYRSSGPEAAPFVSVGDKISKGQTVCIIEAM